MPYSIRAIPVAELPVPGWECFFGKHDTSFHTLVFYVWVVRGNGKTIVIDAGPPADDEDMRMLVDACRQVDPHSLMRRLRSLEEAYSIASIRRRLPADHSADHVPLRWSCPGNVPSG